MDRQKQDTIWELVVGEVNNSLDESSKAELETVINSAEAQNALKRAKQLHSKSADAFLASKIDKEKNWNYILNQINKSNPVRKIYITIARYAAVFVLAVLLGMFSQKLFFNNTNQLAGNTIEMEWGQMGKINLSDGTQVWLNAGTTFEYPSSFNTKQRLVKLNGEAQFKVSHNKTLPFVVQTKTGNIKVLGTTFNVSSYDDDAELTVTLIEGKVTVENSNGDYLTTLNPSQQLCVNKQTGAATLKQVDTKFYSSWIDGKIVLEDTKLSDLTVILKRWYNVDIHLEGEGTGDIMISGTILKGKPLDLFLKILERMYGINYQLKINNNAKDEVIIYKN
ncbi:FecR domain-containing protein [uncultured Draconibacterium sp.]|uniref:FecR family protein n=1 Tax=uncultured Draconibacterium sp. TaxID=1573823 RepID=UPI003216DA5C